MNCAEGRCAPIGSGGSRKSLFRWPISLSSTLCPPRPLGRLARCVSRISMELGKKEAMSSGAISVSSLGCQPAAGLRLIRIARACSSRILASAVLAVEASSRNSNVRLSPSLRLTTTSAPMVASSPSKRDDLSASTTSSPESAMEVVGSPLVKEAVPRATAAAPVLSAVPGPLLVAAPLAAMAEWLRG